VVENGEFSIFPKVARNLTVITGPGFDLVGQGLHLPARPFAPVVFSGETALRAEGVTAPSDDFNVMSAVHLHAPEVAVINGVAQLRGGDLLAVYALAAARVNGKVMAANDLILTAEALDLSGHVIAVRLFG
jgi:hypothetical protein